MMIICVMSQRQRAAMWHYTSSSSSDSLLLLQLIESLTEADADNHELSRLMPPYLLYQHY